MKRYADNHDVVRGWYHQRSPDGRAGGNLRFEGRDLIHYSTVIARLLPDGRALLTPTHYSQSTSRVQGLVRATAARVILAPVDDVRTGESMEHFGVILVQNLSASVCVCAERAHVSYTGTTKGMRNAADAIVATQEQVRTLIVERLIRASSVPRAFLTTTKQEGETSRMFVRRFACTVLRRQLTERECAATQLYPHSWTGVGNLLRVPLLTGDARRKRRRLLAEWTKDAPRDLREHIERGLHQPMATNYLSTVQALAACAQRFLRKSDPLRLEIEAEAATKALLCDPRLLPSREVLAMQLIADGFAPHIAIEAARQVATWGSVVHPVACSLIYRPRVGIITRRGRPVRKGDQLVYRMGPWR